MAIALMTSAMSSFEMGASNISLATTEQIKKEKATLVFCFTLIRGVCSPPPKATTKKLMDTLFKIIHKRQL